MNNMREERLIVGTESHSYPILIGAGLQARAKDYIPDELQGRRFFYVCDTHTHMYAEKLAGDAPVFVTGSGEQTKSFNVLEEVVGWCLQHKIDRKSVIVAVGGGVIGDLAGFAAAITMRGVPVIQVPTTLLAMVDSSVGGKTGINTAQGKNLVGAFHQPALVLCDTDALKTLPERELKAGYAEILKYGLLGDAAFFDWLEQNGQAVLDLDAEAVRYAVKRSCEMKAAIVREDEFETKGLRALLNLGHTFGHAFEAAMGYDGRLLHGEGVAVGMVCAMELSAAKGLISSQQVERVVQHMQKLGLKTNISEIGLPQHMSAEALLDLMRGDKKASGGRINFVLMRGIGEAFISGDVGDAEVIKLLS